MANGATYDLASDLLKNANNTNSMNNLKVFTDSMSNRAESIHSEPDSTFTLSNKYRKNSDCSHSVAGCMTPTTCATMNTSQNVYQPNSHQDSGRQNTLSDNLQYLKTDESYQLREMMASINPQNIPALDNLSGNITPQSPMSTIGASSVPNYGDPSPYSSNISQNLPSLPPAATGHSTPNPYTHTCINSSNSNSTPNLTKNNSETEKNVGQNKLDKEDKSFDNIQNVTLDQIETFPFKILLKQPTSPLVKKFEETLTYLNQGDFYELEFHKAKSLPANQQYLYDAETSSKTNFILSRNELFVCIRVAFNETKLQSNTDKEWKAWYDNHQRNNEPFDRAISIDLESCINVEMPNNCKSEIYTSTFVWDSSKLAKLQININSISTEFTEKKKGGERGVPFKG